MAHPSLVLSFRVCNEDTISHDVVLSPAFAGTTNMDWQGGQRYPTLTSTWVTLDIMNFDGASLEAP
jgi:hypothetical protein